MLRRESNAPPPPDKPGFVSRYGTGVSLPSLLLAAAFSYIFVFGEHRDHFYWMHDWTSSNNMTVAANLSPDHDFLGFRYRFIGSSGDPEYAPYNRFPLGAAVLTKLAMAPFEGSLSASIFAAKTLSVLLFCGCALLAYLALGRLFHDRWGAAAAVLLAFSSWYALGFADMAGEGMVSLFGVMLAFHGLVVFVQEGRFRQLLGKTCAALLLGWHVAGLVLAFVALSTVAAAIGRATTDIGPRFGRVALYGGISFAFAVFVMSVNFFVEYRTDTRKRAFTDLPSVESALSRTGIFDRYGVRNVETAYDGQKRMIARVAEGSIPFAFFDPGADPVRDAIPKAPVSKHVVGVLVLAVVCVGLFFIRHGLVTASFVLSGFVWGAMAPFTLMHKFEAMFYIPVSLFFYSLVVRLARRAMDPRFVSVLCFMWAAAIFGVSNVKMSAVVEAAPRAGGTPYARALRALDDGGGAAAFHRAALRDFDAVRAIMPRDARVFVTAERSVEDITEFSGAYAALYFYLSGYIVNHRGDRFGDEAGYRPDFVLSRRRIDSPSLLTPENDVMFLYNGAALCEAAAGDSRPDPARVLAGGGLEFPCGR